MNAITTRRAMKSSGVDWIGDIPVNWEVKRIKSIFNISRGRVIAFSDVQPFGMYPVYSSQTLNFGILGYISSYDYEGAMLTWTTDGANAGTVFLRCGQFNCTNVCGILQLKLKLHYSLALLNYSVSHATEFYKRPDTNGAKIMSNEMARICIVIPPLSEQILIAQYLDSRTQIIDAKIQLLQDKSTALFELRKSVIHQAVTKGLPTEHQMAKGSSIPQGWKMKRIKEFCSYESGDTPDSGTRAYYADDSSGMPWLTIRDLGAKIVYSSKNHISTAGIKSKNMRLQKAGTLMMSFKLSLGITSIAGVDTYTNEAIASFKNLYNPYWYYALNVFTTANAKENIYGAGLLNKTLLLNAVALVPPPQEQILIAQYLDARTSIIDESIATIKEQIDALKALRQSLIHEAVTGKVDVTTLKVIAPCLQENLPNPT